MPLATATNTAIPDSLKTTSLFKEHLLGTKSIGYKFHYTHYDYLPAGIMLFCFLVFVWLFVSNRKRLSQTVKGFYANRFASQLARKESNYGNAVTTFLTVIFVLTMTLFISKAIQYYYPQSIVTHNFVMLNIVVCGIVALTYLLKFISIKVTGTIFQESKVASEYISSFFLFCNALGLFMLPIVMCISFVRQVSPVVFIYSGEFIIVLFILIRIVRGAVIWLNGLRGYGFYLFLYLCTLEILPFAVLIKSATLLIK